MPRVRVGRPVPHPLIFPKPFRRFTPATVLSRQRGAGDGLGKRFEDAIGERLEDLRAALRRFRDRLTVLR
jgi:hypothetical protein